MHTPSNSKAKPAHYRCVPLLLFLSMCGEPGHVSNIDQYRLTGQPCRRVSLKQGKTASAIHKRSASRALMDPNTGVPFNTSQELPIFPAYQVQLGVKEGSGRKAGKNIAGETNHGGFHLRKIKQHTGYLLRSTWIPKRECEPPTQIHLNILVFSHLPLRDPEMINMLPLKMGIQHRETKRQLNKLAFQPGPQQNASRTWAPLHPAAPLLSHKPCESGAEKERKERLGAWSLVGGLKPRFPAPEPEPCLKVAPASFFQLPLNCGNWCFGG